MMQRQQWDDVAAGWKKWWETIESGAQRVSERMLELADVQSGQRVLDIATGIGEPALMAARRVGPTGTVVATDLSPQMLDIARERTATAGLTNVEFLEADASRLAFPDGRFDAVLCRWGITSLPNPFDTLVAIRRMLSPTGSFATAVWEGGPKGRPLTILANDLAREMFGANWSRPGAAAGTESTQHALEQEMLRAGFSDVRGEEMMLTFEWRSAADCTQYLMDVSPDLATLLSNASPGKRAEYRQGLAERLRRYESANGRVQIPNVTICAVGRRR